MTIQLNWSTPRPVGDGQFVEMEARPTPYFWSVWKANKEELKKSGVRVVKTNGIYKVIKTEFIGGSEPAEPVKLPAVITKRLRPYQVPHTEKLIQDLLKWGAVTDGSDPGVGKSFCALALSIFTEKRPFIVAPKSALTQWKHYCSLMQIEALEIINPESLRTGKTEWLSKQGKTEFEWHLPADVVVILDEAHWAKGRTTQIGKMTAALRDAQVPVMLLSATIGDNPLHFANLGYVLRFFSQPTDFWPWAWQRGCKKGKWGGVEFDGEPEHLEALHREIYQERGSRIRIAELPPGAFPETQISIEYVQSNTALINRTYKQEIKRLASEGNDAPNHLVAGLRFRQIAELEKVTAIVGITEIAVFEGQSVAIFVNFIDTLEAVSNLLKTDCIVHGSVTGKDRDRNIERFQSDKSRIIVLQVASGGQSISLHDTRGKFARLALISPPWSAIQFRQVCGRVHREGGETTSLQKVLIAKDSIEEHVANRLGTKLDRIDLINDGDLDLFKNRPN